MKPRAAELVVDFLVSAHLASRYRARLAALSPSDAELRLTFCPSIFRSGILESCPAEISLVSKALTLRFRGVFRVDRGSTGTIGRVHFVPPLALRDLELLRAVCGLDSVVGTENDLPQSSEHPPHAFGDRTGIDAAFSSSEGEGAPSTADAVAAGRPSGLTAARQAPRRLSPGRHCHASSP